MGLDRVQMEIRHQIKEASLQKWEYGQSNITPKNITRLVSVALEHSIECTPEWLISGSGHPPKTIQLNNLSPTSETSEEDNFLKDIAYFKSSYPDGLTLFISDNSMAPTYQNGDFVAGNTVDLNNLKNYLDFVCIVETEDGKKRLRKIGYEGGVWFLYGSNFRQKGIPFLEINVKIKKVAPVFWHRIKN